MTNADDRTETDRAAPHVRLRRTGHDDLRTVAALFAGPAFSTWGGGALSDEEITAKYLGGRSPAVECFLVEYRGAVVGFTQLHVADDGGEGGGMDLVLLSAARGQGVGTAVVREMVVRAHDKGWSRFMVDPDVANEAGFWRTVGFVPQRIVRDDPNRAPYWIMAWPAER